MELIDKSALAVELEKRIEKGEKVAKELPSSAIMGLIQAYKNTLSFLDTLEVKEVTNEKTDWFPNKKQMESLKDMLKWNIGDFNYQKWMEVNSLYNDLIKILDYETDR